MIRESRPLLFLILGIAFLAAGGVVAQDVVDPAKVKKSVVRVDASGEGDVLSIEEGLARVTPGGLLVVSHGIYEGALVSHPVRIVGEPAEGFQFDRVVLRSPLVIKDIPKHQAVVVADLAGDVSKPLDVLISIQNCKGSVFTAFTFWMEFLVQDSSLVSIDRHRLGTISSSGSRIFVSRSGFANQTAPVISMSESEFYYSRSTPSVLFPDPRRRKVELSDSVLTLGSGAYVAPADINLEGTSSVVDRVAPYVWDDTDSDDVIVLEALGLAEPDADYVLVALGVSPFYSSNPSGDVWVGSVAGPVAFGTDNAEISVLLPEGWRPSRYNAESSQGYLVPNGTPHLQGLVVVIQAAGLTETGEAHVSLPVFGIL